ncbi:heat shock 22 kDa protein mitochondrial [Phtheirospermum japonicum]|uniref:Heat shock 22 kDa protein mitochondrial n=1 Tax=Phtheirospermum japonicum TaxID=374723 RepID=A0A830C3T9_9LAMI|nr:heat shock 22 kDa protein mitochondrial [Phtheirospermum japonicum]
MISDCVRETWDSMETDGLYLRVDMPGVGKESVKVWVEKEGTLVMEGEGKKDFKDDEFGLRYTNSIQLPQIALLNTKAIKAEMVNDQSVCAQI